MGSLIVTVLVLLLALDSIKCEDVQNNPGVVLLGNFSLIEKESSPNSGYSL